MRAAIRRKGARSRYVGLVYILPWIIGLLIFQAYPFLYSQIGRASCRERV